MISVCMATYNGAKFIKQQIDSIFSQLKQDDELIISDDGSTDDTLKIIEKYNDQRIKIFHHLPNPVYSNHQKATENFENALKNAEGDYIFLTDQDDIWLPNKISVCLTYLKKSDFIVHNMAIINTNNEIIKPVLFNDYKRLHAHWFQIVWKLNFWGCCMAFSRKVLDCVLPFPQKIIGHDYWIMALALKHFKCCYIPDVLINYREHSDSVSYNRKTTFLYKLSYRLKLLSEILFR